MPEFNHPTTGQPPSATNGYDFDDWSVAINGQHCAWDVGVLGYPIRNIKEGVVSWEGWHWQLGWHIYVTADDGMRFLYAHMQNRALVRQGQRIGQGHIIGHVGGTGTVTGPHLHFAMSYQTVAAAVAKVAQYGGSSAHVKWRDDHKLAYVDPAIFIGKELNQEDDDMDSIIVLTTIGGPAQYTLDWLNNKKCHISWPTLVAINTAEAQNKVRVARVGLSPELLAGIPSK